MINLPIIEKSFPFGEPTSTRLFIPVPIQQNFVQSDMIDVHGGTVMGMYVPAMTAALLRFTASVDGGATESVVVNRNGTPASVTLIVPAQPSYIAFDEIPRAMAEAVRWFRIHSYNAAGPVAEAAARTITLVVKYTS